MNSRIRTLDELVEISNIYFVKPSKVINIYNKYLQKDYVNLDIFKAVELTERYISMNFPLRTSGSYKVVPIYYIEYEKSKED